MHAENLQIMNNIRQKKTNKQKKTTIAEREKVCG